MKQVTVEYGRTVSDGNFGSERVSVALTATKTDDERTAEVVAELASVAQGLVTLQLKDARSVGVRRTLAAESWGPGSASGEREFELRQGERG